ncbi:3'-5' exonuclease [Corynebacterium uterequi]|uniref:DNA 3'-5' helicase n=1 Tax=Corynebacterium uterequi TaxID=1072256 RepID=A0A0G3HLK4_9CORY|nr:3'-5' exonuclease [Corynebacterium uterequi]AKK12017.1 UvrD-like helicase C-terminal domain/UvrD/REP helicase N-terminal domain [Corynebacterium uterequi]
MATSLLLADDFEFIPGLEKQTASFMKKLRENPANPSLRVKPLKSAADPRVRTARVTDKYRAVLMEFQAPEGRRFLLIRIDNHDEANDYAARLVVRQNPVNGVFSLITETPPASAAAIDAEVESRAKRLVEQRLAEQQAAQQAEQQTTPAVDVQPAAVPAAVPAAAPRDTLTAAGITDADLTDTLGVSPVAVAATWRADSEADLDALLFDSPTWERDAILGLLAGMSVEEVRDDLGLSAPERPAASSQPDIIDDTDALAGLKRSGIVIEPTEQELQDMIEHGRFEDWRVFLHHSQRKAVEGSHKGSARIVGGAGTGKTVVLVHRARHLQAKYPKSRMLLTTFTRSLSNQLKTLMNTLDPDYMEASRHGSPGLWIAGIDALVRGVLTNAQKTELADAMEAALGIRGAFYAPVSGREEDTLWNEAAELHGDGMAPAKLQPEFLRGELYDIILTENILTEAEYLRVTRTGRGTPLNRAERKKVWAICRSFLRHCELNQHLPFPALAMVAAVLLEQRGCPMFDHALVDEAQDFHAGHWRFLRAAVAEGPDDLFIAEDSHQRIYGRRLPLRRFGIETRGRASTRLKVNYRTTAQNLAYATAVLEGGQWIDSEDVVDTLDGYRSLTSGPNPVIARAGNKSEEFELIAATVRGWLAQPTPSLHIGILARGKQRVHEIETYLSEQGITVSTNRSGADTLRERVSVMTMHNAKGMEFTNVILADVSDASLPMIFRRNELADAERDDALLRERALLYVAASRARDQLVITMTGRPSTLLPHASQR